MTVEKNGGSERIVLRDWVIDDLEPLVAWTAPGHRWQELDAPYLPRSPVGADFVERVAQRILEGDWEAPRARLAIADAATSALLGQVSRYWESVETDWLSIGIVIYDPAHWGRGIGTQALGRWTTYLFAEMPHLVRLGLRTWSGNEGMMRLARGLGFVEEARFRKARIVGGAYYDSVGFGVLREEWERRWPEGFAAEVRLVDPPEGRAGRG